MNKTCAMLVVSSLFFAACGKSSTDGSSSASADPGAAQAAEKPAEAPEAPKPAGNTTLTLATVDNLKITVPEGTSAGENLGGSGALLQGPGLILSVQEASDSRPKTLADAKEHASMYEHIKFTTETLPDGWTATYETVGGNLGNGYYVSARREIGGKTYWCETTNDTPEQAQNALAACKSLSL